MAATLTSIRLDKKLADEVKRALGVKTRTEAVHRALEEIAKSARPKRRLALDKPLIRPAGRRIELTNEQAYELVQLP
jgi:hypothetical protein